MKRALLGLSLLLLAGCSTTPDIVLRNKAGQTARCEAPPHSRSGFIRTGERTLFPGGPEDPDEVDLGLRLRPPTLDAAAIRAELNALLTPDIALQFRVVHDSDGGTSTQAPLAPALDRDALVAAIMQQLPPARDLGIT